MDERVLESYRDSSTLTGPMSRRKNLAQTSIQAAPKNLRK
jgi:hypothetical protein